MRKQIINDVQWEKASPETAGLDLQRLASVELTSEDPEHPIEAAFGAGGGWRASAPGEQIVRLLFDEPQRVRQISLLFREDDAARTQEFALSWREPGGTSYREILRQQFTFSPPVTSREQESYQVNLENVDALEIKIIPQIGGGNARASIESLRLA